MKKFVIGDREFPSKKAAADKVKAILNWGRDCLGEKIPEVEAEFLRNLINDHHPEAEEKIGGGIDYFFVDKAGGEFNSTCFWFMRRGESVPVEFSYRECFNPTSLRRKFHMACRTAILEDIRRARAKAIDEAEDNTPWCEELEAFIRPEDAVVDHMYPMTFHTLVELFSLVHGLELNEGMLVSTGDRVFEERFADDAFVGFFRRFHQRVVNHFKSLRLIHKDENARLGGMQRFRGAKHPIFIGDSGEDSTVS